MQWIQLNYLLLFFGQLQDGDIQDGGIQIGVLFFLAPMQHVVAQLHSITIFEDNKDTFRFTIRQPLRIHCPGRRRLPTFNNVLLQVIGTLMDDT